MIYREMCDICLVLINTTTKNNKERKTPDNFPQAKKHNVISGLKETNLKTLFGTSLR